MRQHGKGLPYMCPRTKGENKGVVGHAQYKVITWYIAQLRENDWCYWL